MAEEGRRTPGTSAAEVECLEAVRQDGNALEYVPEFLRSESIYIEAVLQGDDGMPPVAAALTARNASTFTPMLLLRRQLPLRHHHLLHPLSMRLSSRRQERAAGSVANLAIRTGSPTLQAMCASSTRMAIASLEAIAGSRTACSGLMAPRRRCT